MAEVRLLGAVTSLFCTRIEWALKLKGVEYEYLEEDLRNKSKMLLEFNPVHKKIPVLIHHGKPIAESCVILEYVDDMWKHAPLLPAEPYDKAMARFWAAFIDDKCLYGAWWASYQEGEEKEMAIETALELLAILEKQIEGKKFFSGSEQIGYLDLVAGWIPLWLNALEEVGGMKLLVEDKFPNLHSWSQRFVEIPLIKESLPPIEKIVDYFSSGMSYVRSLQNK